MTGLNPISQTECNKFQLMESRLTYLSQFWSSKRVSSWSSAFPFAQFY